MERTSVGEETRSEQQLTEPTASHLHVSHFWRAAVEFVGLNEEDKIGGGVFDSVMEEEGESNLPRFMRGFGFRDDTVPRGSRTAEFTVRDDPLPRPLPNEFDGPAWVTIQNNPHLFRVQTPINVDRLESLLETHPNKPFVQSVLLGLREGFWPWATTQSREDFPVTWDNSWAPLPSARERDFVNDQCELEASLGRHSPAFGPELLPGMYSTPVITVPKPHSNDLRLVANQSAGDFCQNNMVDKSQTKGNRLDSLLVFLPLLLAPSRSSRFAGNHCSRSMLSNRRTSSSSTHPSSRIPLHPLSASQW